MGNKITKQEVIVSSQIKPSFSKAIRNFEITPAPSKAFFSKLQPKPTTIDDEFSYETKVDVAEQHAFSSLNQDPSSFGPSADPEAQQLDLEEESVIEEIKIKWNNFIKMKNKNYLEEYTIIKEIGKGGFGTVSKVRAKYTGVVRAAKKIKKSALAKAQHEKLFQEMAIMIALDHPNITRLFEVYDYKNSYVLILELCQGGQLFNRIVTKSTNETTSVAIITQLLRALVYLHGKKIVHRDLKPENLLFQKGTDYIKLIDFGIAVRRTHSEPLSARIGTPYYIAPEVLCKRYDEKCDIWSVGVILYMMLCFKPPFSGDTEIEVMEKIIKADPNYQIPAFNNVTRDCLDFLKKLLCKNPEKRLSALQAYNHPWVQKYLSKSSKESEHDDAIDNLSTFKFANKLQAVVYTYIVSQILSSQEKCMLKQLFQQLDKNHDGVISTQEFKKALATKKQISQQRINFLVRVIDTNGSGQIDFTEFIVAALEPQKLTQDHFEQAFSYFDIDHSGTITYDEIAAFLEDKENSQEEIRQIFKQVDENRDGLISKEEFIEVLTARTKQRKLQKLNKRNKSARMTPKKTLIGSSIEEHKENNKRLSG